MRLYWEIALRGYRRFATYRAATLAGVVTNTVFGFMRAYVFIALFSGAITGAIAGSRAEIGGFSLSDTLTFVFLGQGVLMVVYLWGWWEIALTIRSGAVVTDFSRPIDYQLYWLTQDLGRAVYHAVFRGFPPFILGALVFSLRLPRNVWTWPAFALSLALAVCISFGFRFIVNLSAFWLLDYRGVGSIMTAVWTFFSGFVVPIAFFPGALQAVSRALPFAAMVNTPIEIFLEKPQGAAVLAALAGQALWAVVLLGAGRLLLLAATRRLVIQGG
jgi:ABC-2 type transport system permease protein